MKCACLHPFSLCCYPSFHLRSLWDLLACICAFITACIPSICFLPFAFLAFVSFRSFRLLPSICVFVACLHTRFLLSKCSCNLLCCFLASIHALARWISCFVPLLVARVFRIVCCFISLVLNSLSPSLYLFDLPLPQWKQCHKFIALFPALFVYTSLQFTYLDSSLCAFLHFECELICFLATTITGICLAFSFPACFLFISCHFIINFTTTLTVCWSIDSDKWNAGGMLKDVHHFSGDTWKRFMIKVNVRDCYRCGIWEQEEQGQI